MKRTFLFATIASILSTGAFAVSATVTSKDYVDTQDALKQDIIEATLPFFSAGGVVETTQEDGVVTQRGICNAELDGDGNCFDDFLVTRDLLQEVQDSVDNLPTIETSKLTCYDSPDCTLWSVADRTVYGACKAYGERETNASECCSGVLYGSSRCGCASFSDCIGYPETGYCSYGRCYSGDEVN